MVSKERGKTILTTSKSLGHDERSALIECLQRGGDLKIKVMKVGESEIGNGGKAISMVVDTQD